MAKKPQLLVLESPWSPVLSVGTSMRPFLDGWVTLRGMSLSYRMYHDKDDLQHWLSAFVSNKHLTVCYIAGHGVGGRLAGLTKDINLKVMANATKKKGVGGGRKGKGLFLGACDVGGKLKDLLDACGSRVKWVAGYENTVPWMEATLCDLLFLEYIFYGRNKITGDKFVERDGGFLPQRTTSAEKVAKWVRTDCALAKRCGLRAIDRR